MASNPLLFVSVIQAPEQPPSLVTSITLRDLFAAFCAAGLTTQLEEVTAKEKFAGVPYKVAYSAIATMSFELADALLAQRAEGEEPSDG